MAYCTATDIENVLSSAGVDLRTDDGAEGTFVDEVIEEADTEIDAACWYLYSSASLLTNSWVNHKAKWIAAYLLCLRRGNSAPEPLQRQYERALELLEKVRLGQMVVPKAVMSKGMAPTMTNMSPALRPHPRSVVDTKRSTGKAEGYNQSNRDPWDRLPTIIYDFVI